MFQTHPDIRSLVSPLESVIWAKFIPLVTSQDAPGELLRDLLALPMRLGSLGIIKPKVTSGRQFSTSVRVTGLLTSLTVNQ